MDPSSSSSPQQLRPAEVLSLASLVEIAPAAVVSRVLARSSGGSVTLFAFAERQELSEHTAPFDALIHLVEGALEVVIGGTPMRLTAGELVLMPANVPHALTALCDAKMVLTMLRQPPTEGGSS